MNSYKKSQGVSFALTLIFGPFGVLYSSAIGGLLCIIVALMLSAAGPLGWMASWIISIVLGAVFVEKHNQEVMIRTNL